MIILDTNVISALMRRAADEKVVAWLDTQPRASIWTSAVTLMEISFGLQIMPLGRRRSLLMSAFEKMLISQIGERIATFDAEAARRASELMAVRYKDGRQVELRDAMIAGIALARHAALATRNTAHFQDVEISVINPWAS
jgi:toxin FitB